MTACRLALTVLVLACLHVRTLSAQITAPYAVLTGRDSSVVKEEYLRIMTEAEWKAVWERHAAKHPKIARGFPLTQRPVIDFGHCMVIAVFLGSTWNAEGLKVVEVLDQQDKLVIGLGALWYQTVGPDGGGDEAVPYAFVILPTSNKSIVLQTDTRDKTERADKRPPKWKEFYRFPALQSRK